MKIGIYTLVVEYYDQLDTHVFTSEDDAVQQLRDRFTADHSQLDGDFEQEQLDALSADEFRDLINDYDVTNEIEYHELEV